MITLHSKTGKVVFAVIASLAGIMARENVWRLTSYLGLDSNPMVGTLVKAILIIAAIGIILLIVLKPKEIFSFLGLDSNIIKGGVVALISLLPAYAIYPFIANVNQDISIAYIVYKSLLYGFIEEFFSIAFMFGLFFRYAKTGFLWAILLPAVLCASAQIHHDEYAILWIATFGTKFIEYLYFGWIYTEWRFNIWIPIGIRVLISALMIFSFDGSGYPVAFILISCIALSIFITIYYHKKTNDKLLDYPVWDF